MHSSAAFCPELHTSDEIRSSFLTSGVRRQHQPDQPRLIIVFPAPILLSSYPLTHAGDHSSANRSSRTGMRRRRRRRSNSVRMCVLLLVVARLVQLVRLQPKPNAIPAIQLENNSKGTARTFSSKKERKKMALALRSRNFSGGRGEAPDAWLPQATSGTMLGNVWNKNRIGAQSKRNECNQHRRRRGEK